MAYGRFLSFFLLFEIDSLLFIEIENEPGGVVGMGRKETSGEGIGGTGSGGGISERMALRGRFLIMLNGFKEGFLRTSSVRLDSFEWMLKWLSDGRAVAEVATLILEALACRLVANDENEGLWGMGKRWLDFGGGVG